MDSLFSFGNKILLLESKTLTLYNLDETCILELPTFSTLKFIINTINLEMQKTKSFRLNNNYLKYNILLSKTILI